MSIIITGAAGFIGSNLVRALNERGETDIVAVDHLRNADKFKNLLHCEIADYLDREEFIERLGAGDFDGLVSAVLHQGACSDTMEQDGQYMMANNFRYSQALLDFCQDQDVPLIYASSAAVYGKGKTFAEQREMEAPLNIYGYSKFLFDQMVRRRLAEASAQIVGLRYFNVYGPHEAHKGRMASVAFHHFQQYFESGKVKLFAGNDDYGDGMQCRDFVYVDDVVKVNLFFLDHPEKSGIFNLGSGRAQPFNDVAVAVVNACRNLQEKPPLALDDIVEQGLIEYIPFPEALMGKYQSYTCADISALRAIGYAERFGSVEQGVAEYVTWLEEYGR